MENEKKEKVTEKVSAEKSVLLVEREQFTGKNGETYWSYVLKGKVRDRDIKVDFAPKDKGGYEPLDILFDVQDKAELLIGEDEMSDSVTGKVTKFKTYTLKTVDTDGVDYTCSVKPSRDSDKALLRMLINTLNKGGVAK